MITPSTDGLPAEREARLPTSYGQEPDGYGKR